MAALYLAQGIPWGFATITLAALLAEQGADASTIGKILAAVVLPWSFKFVGGPLVDGIRLPGGRRRPWILIAQIGMMATLLGLYQESVRPSIGDADDIICKNIHMYVYIYTHT